MKKKFTSIASGLSAVSLLAFALAACVSENISAPTGNTTCNCDVQSSSSCDGVPPSSSETIASSETVTSSETSVESSSSAAITSSSNVAKQSSSSVVAPISTGIDEKCLDMLKMCPPGEDEGDVIPHFPCNSCISSSGEDRFECNTGELYVCGTGGTWTSTGLTEENLMEMATDVKAEPPTGAAVTPRVVKVVNEDGSVTFRDDGAKIYNGFVVAGVRGILKGDILYVKILYPDSSYKNGGLYNVGSQQGVITFTLGKDFANVKQYRYIEDVFKIKSVFEEKSSSSSVAASSSSWKKLECITMSRLCPPCDGDDCPISAMPCSQCYNQYGAETYDCETNERYICSRSDTWDRTCYNLTDSTGNIAKDSCSLNFGAWLDCKTNKPFVCKEGRWERLPEEYSWVHQKCDRTEADRQINIEYKTEKGSVTRVASVSYCDGVYWQQGGTSTPERHLCEIEGDKVTIKGKTYQCLGGEWSL